MYSTVLRWPRVYNRPWRDVPIYWLPTAVAYLPLHCLLIQANFNGIVRFLFT